jgi:hypothetical protein
VGTVPPAPVAHVHSSTLSAVHARTRTDGAVLQGVDDSFPDRAEDIVGVAIAARAELGPRAQQPPELDEFGRTGHCEVELHRGWWWRRPLRAGQVDARLEVVNRLAPRGRWVASSRSDQRDDALMESTVCE